MSDLGGDIVKEIRESKILSHTFCYKFNQRIDTHIKNICKTETLMLEKTR